MSSAKHYRFGPFRVDLVNQCLWLDTERVNLGSRALAILVYLMERAGRLVTKTELLDAVWPETYVNEHALTVQIREIRKALNDDPSTPTYIETRHRRGYSFIAEVSSGEEPPVSFAARARSVAVMAEFPALVGRAEEQVWLEERFHRALDGRAQILFVSGEPGIGKSALVKVFLELAAQSGTLIARGQCLELFGTGEPYMPVLDALSRLCREQRGEQIIAALEHYAPTWLAQMPALLTPERRQSLEREILGATRERMLREIAEALDALSAEVPLILSLEDLHWSDYGTLDLIGALARRRLSGKLMVISTYRPVEVILSGHPLKNLKHELLVQKLCEELDLDLLVEENVREYLTRRLGELAESQDFAPAVYRRTGGNPLFMVNLVDHLERAGQLVSIEGHWRLTVSAEQVEGSLPDSLHHMIEHEVERLRPEERALLEAASVTGLRFAAPLAGKVVGLSPADSERHCEELSRRLLFLKPSGMMQFSNRQLWSAFEFRHSLYREVFYARLMPARRATLHRAWGEALEEAADSRAADSATVLAVHFEEAFDYRRAIKYLELAAETATRRFANREAVDQLRRAEELATNLPAEEMAERRIQWWSRTGSLLRAMNEKRGAFEAFGRIVSEARTQGRVDLEVSGLMQQCLVLYVTERPRCLELAEETLSRALSIEDESLQVRARGFRAACHGVSLGFTKESIQACEDALVLAHQTGDQQMLAFQSAFLAYRHCFQSRYEESVQMAEQAFPMALEIGDGYLCLAIRSFETIGALLGGKWGLALQLARDGVELANKNGHRNSADFFRLLIAWLALEASALEEAASICDSVLAGEPNKQAQFIADLLRAGVLIREGGLEEALPRLLGLREAVERKSCLPGWIFHLPMHHSIAHCHLEIGKLDEARREALRLVRMTEDAGEKNWAALGRLMLSRIARAAEDSKTAENELAAALRHCDDTRNPLAAWRVLTEVALFAGEKQEEYRRRASVILERLAHSMPPGEAVRVSLEAMCRQGRAAAAS